MYLQGHLLPHFKALSTHLIDENGPKCFDNQPNLDQGHIRNIFSNGDESIQSGSNC
jgi:hypothetical protein